VAAVLWQLLGRVSVAVRVLVVTPYLKLLLPRLLL
jgi:hypothetical protein